MHRNVTMHILLISSFPILLFHFLFLAEEVLPKTSLRSDGNGYRFLPDFKGNVSKLLPQSSICRWLLVDTFY